MLLIASLVRNDGKHAQYPMFVALGYRYLQKMITHLATLKPAAGFRASLTPLQV
jgi:hypothetical protein